MRWAARVPQRGDGPWRRRFAFLPHTTKENVVVWLERAWYRTLDKYLPPHGEWSIKPQL